MVREAIGERVEAGSRFSLSSLQLPSWSIKGARVIATFEDGAPALTISKYGKGTIVTFVPDAWTVAQNLRDLVRDALDYAIGQRGNSPIVDIVGTDENSDVAVAQTASGFRVAVVNYKGADIEVLIRPVGTMNGIEWLDLVTTTKISSERSLKVRVPPHGFRALEFRAGVIR